MADRPQQDKDLNLPALRVGDRVYTAYDPNIALDIIERIAEGELLSDITSRNAEHRTVARSTFLRWVTLYPELAKAYAAATRISALAFEETALQKAKALTDLVAPSPAKVSAFNTYISQLRWSAARRDPTKYSDKGNLNVVVPISINTNLDLGPGVTKGDAEVPDIYTIKVEAKPETQVEEADFVEVADEEVKQEELAALVPKEKERPKLVEELKKNNFRPRKRVLKPRTPKQ